MKRAAWIWKHRENVAVRSFVQVLITVLVPLLLEHRLPVRLEALHELVEAVVVECAGHMPLFGLTEDRPSALSKIVELP